MFQNAVNGMTVKRQPKAVVACDDALRPDSPVSVYKITGLLTQRPDTAMDKTEVRQIMDEVVSNNKLLNGCPGHRFGEIPDDWRTSKPLTRQKFTCSVCGGNMNVHDIVLYRKGYAANGGNPDDVLSGMDKS